MPAQMKQGQSDGRGGMQTEREKSSGKDLQRKIISKLTCTEKRSQSGNISLQTENTVKHTGLGIKSR